MDLLVLGFFWVSFPYSCPMLSRWMVALLGGVKFVFANKKLLINRDLCLAMISGVVVDRMVVWE